jgi:hypothetical protein
MFSYLCGLNIPATILSFFVLLSFTATVKFDMPVNATYGTSIHSAVSIHNTETEGLPLLQAHKTAPVFRGIQKEPGCQELLAKYPVAAVYYVSSITNPGSDVFIKDYLDHIYPTHHFW